MEAENKIAEARMNRPPYKGVAGKDRMSDPGEESPVEADRGMDTTIITWGTTIEVRITMVIIAIITRHIIEIRAVHKAS